MHIIILSGPSGCGKTTMANHLATTKPNIAAIATGDVFKAMAARTALTIPQNPLLASAAFKFFVEKDLELGLKAYEQLKLEQSNKSAYMIQFIETFRSACPDLPSRFFAETVNCLPPHIDTVVTDVIGEEEHQYMITHCQVNGWQTTTVLLSCSNAIDRGTDNRTPLTSGYDLSFGYNLLQSKDVADIIYYTVRKEVS